MGIRHIGVSSTLRTKRDKTRPLIRRKGGTRRKRRRPPFASFFFRRPSRKALLETSGRPEDLTTSNNVETGVLPRQPGCRGKTAHVKRARRSTNVGIRCERVRGRRPK